MYGGRVHESVIASGAIMAGMTIHYVNEHFDEGEIIFQAACHVSKEDTPELLAAKIHALEYMYYPVVIEKLLAEALA
jgi:phosphoribosylglycinamide formyltransferase-1